MPCAPPALPCSWWPPHWVRAAAAALFPYQPAPAQHTVFYVHPPSQRTTSLPPATHRTLTASATLGSEPRSCSASALTLAPPPHCVPPTPCFPACRQLPGLPAGHHRAGNQQRLLGFQHVNGELGGVAGMAAWACVAAAPALALLGCLTKAMPCCLPAPLCACRWPPGLLLLDDERAHGALSRRGPVTGASPGVHEQLSPPRPQNRSPAALPALQLLTFVVYIFVARRFRYKNVSGDVGRVPPAGCAAQPLDASATAAAGSDPASHALPAGHPQHHRPRGAGACCR